MDSRFVDVWRTMSRRRDEGEPFRKVLAEASDQQLVAALAAADEPVAANVIATELLNRLRRAPFLGASVTAAVVVILIFALDRLYTGTFLVLESGPRAYLLVITCAVFSLASALSFAMWRGRLGTLRRRLQRTRRF